MPRISPWIEKWENRAEAACRLSPKFRKYKKKLKTMWPFLLIGLYFYGVFVNSIRLGTAKTFADPDAPPIDSVWEWNPVLSLAAIFTPTGLGVTFFLVIITCLITKRGYNLFSGYKFDRDPRGFDILPDGTHGASGWMKEKQMDLILQRGRAAEMNHTILGKIKEDGDDNNEYSRYVTPKENHRLNDHILVYGATGTGKSRGFVKPFILQAAKRMESLVLVDPKGELFESTSEYLREKGYLVRAYNLLDLENSDGFNCIYDIEQDRELVRTVADIIIKNTSNAKDRQNFWETAEQNLLSAMLYYMADARDENGDLLPIERRSLGAVYNMLALERYAGIAEKINELVPGHPAKAPFDLIKETPIQNRANIVMGLGNRLGVFQNKLVDCATKYNDIDLALPGQRPCAYYCVISDQDSSLEFLSSLFFSLLFSRLTDCARRHGQDGRLPVRVNICLEEFCNIGYLGDSFLRTLSVIRSRNVACQIVIQGIAQISDRYPHREWEEIIGACDWQLFLGCNDNMTAAYISDKCGKVTIRTDSSQMPQQPLFSPVYSSTRPYSITRSSAQRPLMMPDELLQMDNEKSIVFVRGQKPVLLNKITPEELPGFRELKPCRVVDHTPLWRETEAEYERKRQEALAAEAKAEAAKKAASLPAPPVGAGWKGSGKTAVNNPDQQTFYDVSGSETVPPKAGKEKPPGAEITDAAFMPVGSDQLTADIFRETLLRQQPPLRGGEYTGENNEDSRGQ